MINIINVHKSYNKNQVLKKINLNLNKPGIVGLLGPNGSGKTTLLKCLLGMVIPDQGQILCHGQDVIGKHLYRKDIGYLSQIVNFPENLTGRELIDLIKQIKSSKTRDKKLIAMFDLEKELDKKMGNLSGGNKQKINILLATMHDDPIIILDEPSTGLDPLSMFKFKEFLLEEKQRGKLIIITTHIMSLAEELSDDIVFILEGQVYFNGSLQSLLTMQGEENLERAIANILESKKLVDHEPSIKV